MKELMQIFGAFFGIGALTFGGGYTMLPLLQKTIAARRGWATEEEIADAYAIAQCLPGIIAVNTAGQLGYKRRGVPGLAAAILGVITPSVLVILVIAAFIGRFLEIEWVAHAFNGIRVAVLALIFETVTKLWQKGVRDKAGLTIFTVSLAAFALVPLSPTAWLSPAAPIAAAAVCGMIIRERGRKKK